MQRIVLLLFVLCDVDATVTSSTSGGITTMKIVNPTSAELQCAQQVIREDNQFSSLVDYTEAAGIFCPSEMDSIATLTAAGFVKHLLSLVYE